MLRIGSCTEYLSRNFPDAITNAQARANRGVAFKLIGAFTRAVSDLDEAIRLSPSSANYQKRADVHLENGRFDQAITDYTEAIKLDPYNSYARLWRGIAHGLNDSLDKAISDFASEYPMGKDKTIDLIFQKYAQEWLLGFAYLRKNDYTQAIDVFTKYLVSPDPWILAERGRMYLEQKQNKRAIDDFTASIALNKSTDFYFKSFTPNHAEALDGRAMAYEREGEPLKAKVDRDDAIKLSPKTASEYRARAIVRLARGDYQAAANDAEQAAKLDSFNWHWSHNIARAKLALLGAPLQSRNTADDNDSFVLSLHDELPSTLMSSSSLVLNHSSYKITSIDQNTKAVKVLGSPNGILPGLNFLGNIPVWYENRELWKFKEPYRSSYAIIAAIDDYDKLPSGSRQYDHLDHMVDKATELKTVLLNLGFPRDNIIPYFNKDATTVNLRNALQEFWKGGKYESADRLFFYFGGHGDGPDGRGYLITWDIDPAKPTTTGFLMSDIVCTHFPNVIAKHVFVALDACSSGLAIPGMKALGDSPISSLGTLAQIREATDKPARNLLVAGTNRERAFISSDGGLFTGALIRGLKGEADLLKNGIVQFDSLAVYVKAEVIKDAQRIRKRQKPAAYKDDLIGQGEVLFILPRQD